MPESSGGLPSPSPINAWGDHSKTMVQIDATNKKAIAITAKTQWAHASKVHVMALRITSLTTVAQG